MNETYRVNFEKEVARELAGGIASQLIKDA